MSDAIFERDNGFKFNGFEDVLDRVVIGIFLPLHVDIDIAGLLKEGIRRILDVGKEGEKRFLAAFLKDFGGGFVQEHRFEVWAWPKNRLRE